MIAENSVVSHESAKKSVIALESSRTLYGNMIDVGDAPNVDVSWIRWIENPHPHFVSLIRDRAVNLCFSIRSVLCPNRLSKSKTLSIQQYCAIDALLLLSIFASF